MKYLNPIKNHPIALKIRQIFQTIYDNWFLGLVLCSIFYLFLSKDISIEIKMENGTPSMMAYLPQAINLSEEASTSTAQDRTPLSVINPLGVNLFGSSKDKTAAPVPKPEKPIVPPVTTSNAANNFSNISVIMAKDLEKKYGMTKSDIAAKQAICTNYVNRFSSVAVAEMEKFGIPASITLAQALLESDAGGSRLARNNNNHFGIKCFSSKCGKGHCSNFTDDTHKDFFRKYQNVWESFRAHSDLLRGKRYQHLQLLGTKDYKKWAVGLRKAGYATDKKYAEKLIQIIEKMELHQYDK